MHIGYGPSYCVFLRGNLIPWNCIRHNIGAEQSRGKIHGYGSYCMWAFWFKLLGVFQLSRLNCIMIIRSSFVLPLI